VTDASGGPSRSISRQLFDLAAPVIGLNVLNVLALAVDTAMCGRLPDAELVLTALGFASQFIFLILIFMLGLTVGTVALIARAHGSGDTTRLAAILIQSTQLTIAIAVVVAVVGNVFAEDILQVLGAGPQTADIALTYARLLLGGCVFYYLNILYGAAFRGVANTKLPFRIALLTNIINFAINYCLILGNFGFPQLGVRGAAFGTVCAYAIGALVYVVLLRRGTLADCRLPLRPTRIETRLVREIWKVGFPAALDMVIINAMFLSIVGMLGRIDEVAVAAHAIGLRVQALAFIPGLSVSQATGAMVGSALGAGNADRARAVTRSSVLLCTVIMAILAMAFVVFSYPIVAIFDVDAGSHLEALTVEWIRLLGYGMPIVGPHIAFVGCLQGSGSTYSSLSINLVGIAVQLPLSIYLGFVAGMGVTGVWIAFPLSFVIKVFWGWYLVRRGRWSKRLGARI